jgi:Ca2+/Na+ antiporter
MEMHEFNTQAAQLPCKCGIEIGASQLPNTSLFWLNIGFNIFFVLEMLLKFYAYGFFGYWKVPLNCFDGSLVFLIIVEFILMQASGANNDPFAGSSDQLGVGAARVLRLVKFIRFVRFMRVIRVARLVRIFGFGTKDDGQVVPDTSSTLSAPTKEAQQAEEKPAKDVEGAAEEEEEDDDDGPFDPFEIPDSIIGKVLWVTGLPLSVGMWLTIPDCRRERFQKWWGATFTMCIVWIALLATIMVWMVDRFGKAYNIRDSIMGITLLAMGTSIPDCLSSIAVAKRGHGDMAVSSSIGSNIFDVLVGLPVPWFIYTVILRPAGVMDGPAFVPVLSDGLAVMILVLFVMVAAVITLVHLSGWILSVKLGLGMMLLYFRFLMLAIMLDRKDIFPFCEDNMDTLIAAHGDAATISPLLIG